MATPTRRSRSNEPAPRSSRNATPNMVPVFATVGLVVVAALGVAIATKKSEKDAGPSAPADSSAATASNIFGDIDTSKERFMRTPGGGSSREKETHDAPPGMADEPVFQEARKIAAEAKTLVEGALAAEKAGDVPTWGAKAKEAREKLDRALEMTADWHIDLGLKWGSRDAQLLRIDAEIATWRKMLSQVRKAH